MGMVVSGTHYWIFYWTLDKLYMEVSDGKLGLTASP